MRAEIKARIDQLILEKLAGAWKDGWVYGRLCEEYPDLQPDELQYMATRLKYTGWNGLTQEVLAGQWQTEKTRWLEYQRDQAKRARAEQLKQQRLTQDPTQIFIGLKDTDPTELEASLIRVIKLMSDSQKQWLAQTIYNYFNR